MLLNITVLPGDGIGPEVIAEAVRALESVVKVFGHELNLQYKPIGGASVQSSNDPLPADTLQACLNSDAVLLGAVGGPAFDGLPASLRPESGLLRLRSELGAFANLRPAFCIPGLERCSPLRAEVVRATDILIVRELLGGLYFGRPRSIEGANGDRIAEVAFDLARSRRRQVTSVDKANVLDCSRLWREIVTRVATQYADVELRHMYVDFAAMALLSHPTRFDVLLTENMFGDILSDQAGAIVGSIGILGSASLGGRVGLYEPVHGSAPDLAGKGIASPLGAILSAAMMLRYSFKLPHEADCIERSVRSVLAAGFRSADIAGASGSTFSTAEIGAKVAARVEQEAAAR